MLYALLLQLAHAEPADEAAARRADLIGALISTRAGPCCTHNSVDMWEGVPESITGEELHQLLNPDGAANIQITALLTDVTDNAALQSSIHPNVDSLLACYLVALERQPGLSGAVTVGWSVSKGAVHSPAILSDGVQDPLLSACVLGALDTWQLDAAWSGDVRHAIVFNPMSDG